MPDFQPTGSEPRSEPPGSPGLPDPPGMPRPPTRRARPRWAIAAVALGLLAAMVAAYFDALYVTRHLANPSPYDGFALLYNVALIPVSALLLIIGGRRLVQRPWLKAVIVWLGLAWAVAACLGPTVISGPVQPVL